MPKISDKQKEINKDNIIRNAKTLFVQEGYKSVTVDDICKKSKISKGSFYTYFSSKEELFLEVAKDTDRLKTEFEETTSVMSTNPEFTLIDLWNLIFSDISDDDITNYRLKLEFWMEGFNNPSIRSVMQSKSQTSLDIFKDVVQKKYKNIIDDDKLDILSIFFWAQADGLMLYFSAHQRVPSSFEIEEIRKLVRNFIKYIES